MPKPFIPLRENLFAHRQIDPFTGCWLWTGGKFSTGYGVINMAGGHPARVHRVAAMIFLGFNPASPLNINHRCSRRACFNPAHLYPGTDKENAADRKAAGHDARLVGTLHPSAKLSDAKVTAIRRRAAGGETQAALACAFGISRSLVFRIIHRQNWAHVMRSNAR